MGIRTKNILTALIAVVLLGGFIYLAEGRKNDTADDRLDAILKATTTTVERTTTTRLPTTTTSTVLLTTPTTSAPAVTTATTIKPATTATTRRPTTATTRRSTTPTTADAAPVPQNGARVEQADNQPASFTRNADGSFSTTSAPGCSVSERSDPFCFQIGSSGGLTFEVTIRNNTGRTITFPGGALKIMVTVNRPTGTQSQFVMDASQLGPSLAPREGATIKSTTQFGDNGQYTFTATCEVDYGS